ncbi:MAG: DUF1080 domain-containing protein [Candidatus Hydrogenedentes bacterium]|nr:DUF1080 domain-containing protein [Candidatus Hydrogenedentota bacterium]
MWRVLFIGLMAALIGTLGAVGEDDDGIMGVYRGKFISGPLQTSPVSALVVAEGPQKGGESWNVILVVGEAGKDAKHVEMQALSPSKGEPAIGKGSVQFDGKVEFKAILDKGKLTGALGKKKELSDFALERAEIKSPTLGQAPPEGAVVLMDGKTLDAWDAYPLKWNIVEEGAAEVCSSGIVTKEAFGSAQIHVEFRTPFMPKERGQARGNSGVYVQGRYEIQVLDSFGLEPADNLCGGIYKQAVPKVSACLPPLTWQTYDITFNAPQFDAEGKKTKNATITVVQNGITIHENLELNSATPGGVSDQEAATGPLYFQNHGNAVRFRNVWLKPLG